MSSTSTTTRKAPTAKQLQTIEDLAAELGYDNVPQSPTSSHASAIIGRLIADRDAKGGKPAPTSAQIRLLEKLGVERGKQYKIPTTRGAASARIKQILDAVKAPAEQEPTAA
jgi:hypothetical protein